MFWNDINCGYAQGGLLQQFRIVIHEEERGMMLCRQLLGDVVVRLIDDSAAACNMGRPSADNYLVLLGLQRCCRNAA